MGGVDTTPSRQEVFLLAHPAYASSWNTEIVSFVSGLDGAIRSTVDMCAWGMADANQHLHRKTTTLMTNDPVVADVVVRENDEPADDGRDTDSGLDEGDAPADDLQPGESQTKVVDQSHRNLGHPSSREFFKVLKAAHAKPVVLEYVRRGYRCADCDAHSRPQPSRQAAEPRTYEFNRIIALDVFYFPLRGQSCQY